MLIKHMMKSLLEEVNLEKIHKKLDLKRMILVEMIKEKINLTEKLQIKDKNLKI